MRMGLSMKEDEIVEIVALGGADCGKDKKKALGYKIVEPLMSSYVQFVINLIHKLRTIGLLESKGFTFVLERDEDEYRYAFGSDTKDPEEDPINEAIKAIDDTIDQVFPMLPRDFNYELYIIFYNNGRGSVELHAHTSL